MKISKTIIAILLLTIFFQCEKITYQVDNPISGVPTRILMHRGNGFNTDYIENTLEAAKYGLSLYDGVELDVQMSASGTIWLDHDNEVYDCEGNYIACFQELSDDEIAEHSVCDNIERYNTLESVMNFMSVNYPNSYVSVDIKGQYCEILSTRDIMRQMANSLMNLVEKYDMDYRVLVESSSLAFLDEIENQNIIGQCFISFDTIDKGITNADVSNARGISQKYTEEDINKETVKLIHQKGYGVIVWILNDSVEIKKVWDAQPDFIQTDISNFKDYIDKQPY